MTSASHWISPIKKKKEDRAGNWELKMTNFIICKKKKVEFCFNISLCFGTTTYFLTILPSFCNRKLPTQRGPLPRLPVCSLVEPGLPLLLLSSFIFLLVLYLSLYCNSLQWQLCLMLDWELLPNPTMHLIPPVNVFFNVDLFFFTVIVWQHLCLCLSMRIVQYAEVCSINYALGLLLSRVKMAASTTRAPVSNASFLPMLLLVDTHTALWVSITPCPCTISTKIFLQ